MISPRCTLGCSENIYKRVKSIWCLKLFSIVEVTVSVKGHFLCYIRNCFIPDLCLFLIISLLYIRFCKQILNEPIWCDLNFLGAMKNLLGMVVPAHRFYLYISDLYLTLQRLSLYLMLQKDKFTSD